MGRYSTNLLHPDGRGKSDLHSENLLRQDGKYTARCIYCPKAKIVYASYCEAVVASDIYNDGIALVMHPMVAYSCPLGQGYHKGHNRWLSKAEADLAIASSWIRARLYRLNQSIDENRKLFNSSEDKYEPSKPERWKYEDWG